MTIFDVISSVIWSGSLVFLILRLERGYQDWLKKQDPIADVRIQELNKKIDNLQNQMSRLSIQNEFER